MIQHHKPRPDSAGRIPYQDAISYLEQKFGFNASDYQGSCRHYRAWRAAHGKPDTAESMQELQGLHDEYCAASDGERVRPPHEDFWHFVVNLLCASTPQAERLPTFLRLDIPLILETYDHAIAPGLKLEQQRAWDRVRSQIQDVPETLREGTLRHYSPKDTALQPFERTILGYFQAEFGNVVELSLRPA